VKAKALLLALTLIVSGSGVSARAERVTVKDARSLAAALQQARADKRIRHIELATGSYELAAPLVIDEALSGTADARSCCLRRPVHALC
jgi:hypothetical protein